VKPWILASAKGRKRLGGNFAVDTLIDSAPLPVPGDVANAAHGPGDKLPLRGFLPRGALYVLECALEVSNSTQCLH
jgi:hypothetical protein